MRYAIIIYEPESDFAKREGPDAPAYWGAWTAYAKALGDAGIARGGAGLQPAGTATTVRLADGKRQVQDGPYADSKEQLGGFFLIDVPSLDEALEWAARAPNAATGAVEVRPVLLAPE